MAKKKKPVETPKSPPSDLSRAVLLALRAEIGEQQCSDYVRFMFDDNRAKASKRQKDAAAKATLMFAALGFQFYNATRGEAV